jgi:hypothetical protein
LRVGDFFTAFTEMGFSMVYLSAILRKTKIITAGLEFNGGAHTILFSVNNIKLMSEDTNIINKYAEACYRAV